MQMPTNNTTFFQCFFQPYIAGFISLTDEEVFKECLDNFVLPLAIIRDKQNPLFIKLKKHLTEVGVKQELILIILPIGYNTPYLS